MITLKIIAQSNTDVEKIAKRLFDDTKVMEHYELNKMVLESDDSGDFKVFEIQLHEISKMAGTKKN